MANNVLGVTDFYCLLVFLEFSSVLMLRTGGTNYYVGSHGSYVLSGIE